MTSEALRNLIGQLAPLMTEAQRAKVARFACAVFHGGDPPDTDERERTRLARERTFEVLQLEGLPLEQARTERCP